MTGTHRGMGVVDESGVRDRPGRHAVVVESLVDPLNPANLGPLIPGRRRFALAAAGVVILVSGTAQVPVPSLDTGMIDTLDTGQLPVAVSAMLVPVSYPRVDVGTVAAPDVPVVVAPAPVAVAAPPPPAPVRAPAKHAAVVAPPVRAPAPVAKPAVVVASAPVVHSGVSAGIAAAAWAQVGVYQDCTALVSNSLLAVGIHFHGWSAGYLSLGRQVSAAQAVPGDLVYYANGGMGLAHIAVYVGNGLAVHGGWSGNRTVTYSVNVGSGPVYIHIV